MKLMNRPPEPVHVKGTKKGEEQALDKHEPGRGGKHYRGSRDSTGINPEHNAPIFPIMPDIPPA